jgi:hypothetical protein
MSTKKKTTIEPVASKILLAAINAGNKRAGTIAAYVYGPDLAKRETKKRDTQDRTIDRGLQKARREGLIRFRSATGWEKASLKTLEARPKRRK